MNKASKGQAFKESVSDTALAFLITVPLGFGIIAFADWVGIVSVSSDQNIQLVILNNIVFTTVAIIRKTYVRVWFENRRLKRLTNS